MRRQRELRLFLATFRQRPLDLYG